MFSKLEYKINEEIKTTHLINVLREKLGKMSYTSCYRFIKLKILKMMA